MDPRVNIVGSDPNRTRCHPLGLENNDSFDFHNATQISPGGNWTRGRDFLLPSTSSLMRYLELHRYQSLELQEERNDGRWSHRVLLQELCSETWVPRVLPPTRYVQSLIIRPGGESRICIQEDIVFACA